MPCSKIYKGCCYIVYAHFCLLVCVDCVPNAVVTWFSPKPFVYTWQSMTRARHMPNIQKSRQQNDESVRLVDNNSILLSFRCLQTHEVMERGGNPTKEKVCCFFLFEFRPTTGQMNHVALVDTWPIVTLSSLSSWWRWWPMPFECGLCVFVVSSFPFLSGTFQPRRLVMFVQQFHPRAPLATANS